MENRSQTSDGADTLLGRSLGKFRIIERLGSGGMGVVYRAEDTSLGRTVAVKTLAADRTSDPSRNRRLLREARSLATLSHSSIATVYEVGEADGVTFIAMELSRGRSL